MRNLEDLKEYVIDLRRNAFVNAIMGLMNETYIAGYIGKKVPKEIFYGFGLYPIPLDGIDRDILEYSTEEENLCSIVDSSITYAKTDKCPLTHNCKIIVVDDSCPIFQEKMKEALGDSVYFYHGDLEKLKAAIKNVYDRDFSLESFNKAVSLSKEISKELYNLSQTNIESKFLYEVEFYNQFIFSLEERLSLIKEVASFYQKSDIKRKELHIARAIQVLDKIDSLFENYRIIEGSFCMGEAYKIYHKSSYDFLSEKYADSRISPDISFEYCPLYKKGLIL